MKYKLLIILSAILLISPIAYGQTGDPGTKNQKLPPPPSNWSHFFQLFKFKDLGESKINFEAGLSFYSVSYNTWSFRRFEPFIKLRWALLGKYLTLYTMFSTDFSTVNYEMSHFQLKNTDISFTADMKTSGKHTFGGGVQFLLVGWKKLNIYGYGQTQSTSLSSASLKSAVLTLNGARMDIFDQVKDYIDITYTFERYDVGVIVSYQFLNWFTLTATAGYIWLDADIKLALKPELSSILDAVLGVSKNVVPDRLSINQASGFGMLGMKFKLHGRWHLNLEGTVMPAKHPVYYGQISFSYEQ